MSQEAPAASALTPPAPVESAPAAPNPDGPAQAPGLQPPPPVDQTAVPPSEQELATQRQLERADREDSGRGLQFVWGQYTVGYQWLGLNTLGGDLPLDDEQDSVSGLGLGAALGVRLLYFTAGARFRWGFLSEMNVWTLTGEFGMRIPLGRLEPFFGVSAGYLSSHSIEAPAALADVEARDDLQLTGLLPGLHGGVDYFVTPAFAVGVRVDAEVALLEREALAGSDDQTSYSETTSSTGLLLQPTLTLGLHY